MKKVICLLLFLPLLSFSQIKLAGKVLDAVTRQPIPYVNIENFRNQIGVQTNQDGLFELTISNSTHSDTLKISSVGYETKYITNLKSNESAVYELLPAVFQLNEVVIKRSNLVEKTVGIIDAKGKIIQTFSRMKQVPGLQRAVLMKTEGKVGSILKVHFFIGKELFNAPFRVHIYENVDNKPGKDILNKSLEFTAYKKNSWNEFDISNYHLSVPEFGFWVAIESITNENFTVLTKPFNQHNKDGTIDKGVRLKYYGPQILEKFDSNYGLTMHKNLGGKWHKVYGIVHSENEQKRKRVHIDLLVRATLDVY